MASKRTGRDFIPSKINILAIDHHAFSKSILMEVLRGIGLSNDNVHFENSEQVIEYGTGQFDADIALLSHGQDEPLNLHVVEQLRRSADNSIRELPIVLLSSMATKSLILQARDAGVDEIVMRPVAPAQLKTKLRQLIEAPRPFITASNYIGPCRRRHDSESYAGLRRRLDDFEKHAIREMKSAPDADDLARAVSELRSACGELSDERMGLIARVRETAERTMRLAEETQDEPLARTAAAVKLYLDGVGASNLVEPHVLETGINALTQLAVLPKSYHGARQAVASLMNVAVRKKLAHYRNRGLGLDPESEDLLDKINTGSTSEQIAGKPSDDDDDAFDLDDIAPIQQAKA